MARVNCFPILLILVLTTGVCRAQAYRTKADSLKGIFESTKIAEGPDRERIAKLFFKTFPGTFKEFVDIYGYKEAGDSTWFAPLYNASDQVWYFIKKPPYVDPNVFFRKLVNLGIGGRWDADNVSTLQQGLVGFVLHNTKEFVGLLKPSKQSEIRSFFRFLFDGPHPDHPLIQPMVKELKAKLKKIDPAMARMFTEEYSRLIKEMDDHGH